MMRNVALNLIVAVIISWLSHSLAIAEIITQQVSFDKNDLTFKQMSGYDFVTLKNLDVSFDVGDPQLPIQIVTIIIPDGEKVTRIEIIDSKSQMLDGFYDILPAQKPEILSSARIDNQPIAATKPNSAVYQSEKKYPSQIIELSGTGMIGSTMLASLKIFPLQYLPVERRLLFFSEITFQITTSPEDQKLFKHPALSLAQADAWNGMAAALAINSEQARQNEAARVGLSDEYRYVIITSNALVNTFQPLANWKHKKGVSARIITVEWIYSKYTGKDNQDKIRNFIRFACQSWGTIWVLLGGDTNIIPHRSAFAMDCKFGGSSTENNIPCDLYYADLDGSWNDDGDAIYGEIADGIDMFPEVILGRAPVENANEADTFVRKVLQYEKNPPIGGYQKNILFAAEILWAEPYTNTGIAKDMIEASYFPPGFYNVTKLYQDQGNESVASVRDAINRGQHFINHHGHASTNLMGMGAGYFSKNDMSALANRSKQSILFSIGCYPANFEADCIAEAFLNNPNGGGVAFIGNSRYGWGSPGNPGYGYSDRFDDRFFKYLLDEKKFSLGLVLALAKATYIPFSQAENVYRWCMYEITLLGDPEMPVWTDIPDTLSVHYPATIISADETSIPVTVTAHGSPVINALICLMQEDKIYQVAQTDAAGQVRFTITSASPAMPLSLTVTAPNFLPAERSIDVATDAPFVVSTGYAIDDDQGNSDGLLNPFEKICLKIKVKNFGSQPATAVRATIASKHDSLSILKNAIHIGDIAANESVESDESFELALPGDSRNGVIYYLELKLIADNGSEWDQILSLVCATPVLAVQQVNVFDEPNRNGVAEPGETIFIVPTVVNEGRSVASNVRMFLTTDDWRLQFAQDIIKLGTIEPDQTAQDTVVVKIPDSYSGMPAFPSFELSFTTADGYFFQTQIDLTIGTTGYAEDFENNSANWQLPGGNDNQWHITNQDFHSGSRSFYCGDEPSGSYRKNNESILESPAFYLGQNSILSFWAKYNVAIYGVNGFYVRLFDGNEWHKLDFIGSGGALDSTLMGNDWLPYSYDLSCFAPGTVARVQFHWVSDDEPLPSGVSGVFLDDVVIESKGTLIQNNIAGERTLPVQHRLDQNFPNPFNTSTTIRYQIAETSYQPIELSIYNVWGQKVKTLVDRSAGPGYYMLSWDGSNDAGVPVASGVYLYRLHVGKSYLKKKLLLIR